MVGDSRRLRIGGALATWGEGNGDARVAPAAKVRLRRRTRRQLPLPARPGDLRPRLRLGHQVPRAGGRLPPDVVVLSSGIWEVVDRRLEGDDRFRDLTSPDVARFVLGEFLAAIDTLAADGQRSSC